MSNCGNSSQFYLKPDRRRRIPVISLVKLSKEVAPEMIRYETKHHIMENPELPNISVKVVNRNRRFSFLPNKYLTQQ